MSDHFQPPDDMNLAEVDRLLSAMERGEISDEEQNRLETLVCTNPAARQRYVLGLGLIASLEWNAGTSHSSDAPPPGGEGSSGNKPATSAAPKSETIPAIDPFADPMSPLAAGGNPLIPGSTPPGGQLFGWIASTGLAWTLVCVLLIAVVLLSWQNWGEHRTNGTSPPEGLAGSEPKTADPMVAGETPWEANLRAQLSDQNALLAVDSPGSPKVTSIQFGSNTAEIGLEKIGRVTICYPADFRLVGPMRARLNHGQIKVEVTEESGRGFVVETPDGEVTDLGTEFGLDVREGEKTGLVVLDGHVDLRVATTHNRNPTSNLERLVKGDGVLFKKDNAVDRIMSVFSDDRGMYRPASAIPPSNFGALIAEVSDNLPSSETKRFYEILPAGMREDALSYVDRLEHNWNGVDQWGMPAYLLGADYVKTFNADKIRDDFNIRLNLTRPAKVYVFLDDRIVPPRWLKQHFRDTGDKIGLDNGLKFSRKERGSNIRAQVGVGPGVSIDDVFTIWERVVEKPGTIVLGPNGALKDSKRMNWASMYGIAAVEMERSEKKAN